MNYSHDDIETYDGKKVKIEFSDGCSMNLRIVDLMHLRDGGDITADVLYVDCVGDHCHPAIGDTINFKVHEIDHIQPFD